MSSEVLEVRGLCKQYPQFALRDVSFSLRAGTITGFIGRNGAGKTTTLRSLLNLVHPDSGEIRFFGQDFSGSELAVKQRIGYVTGGVSFYPRKKLRVITAVNRRFYDSWDEEAYRCCLERFQLLEDKTPDQLSEGMKVKYALTLALSHRAEMLILDEPTSGLDPVSREDLLEEFLHLVRERQVTILFSTHITSDLDKCADNILYLRSGRLAADASLTDFLAQYRLVKTATTPPPQLLGVRESRDGWTGLLPAGAPLPPGAQALPIDLEAVMVHLEKEA